jgi:hypothetical protein
MKRNVWFSGVALLLTACLLTCCMTTTTWREIRKDPDKYMRQDGVAIKGRVDSVYLAPQGDTGKLVVRDCNGDSGRVEFRDRRGVRSMADKVVVSGKVHEARRDTRATALQALLLSRGWRACKTEGAPLPTDVERECTFRGLRSCSAMKPGARAGEGTKGGDGRR